jgi:hypothetical protein
VDWNSGSNVIVTGGQDRQAKVFVFNEIENQIFF